MKKKLVSVVLTAAMTATLFAGCGSSVADPADTSKSDANASQAAEAAKVDDA